MSSKITVSVVMITYNHEHYIIQALKGVFQQITNFNIEFIISNDNSTDRTNSVIRSFISANQFPENIKIKYHNHPSNKGIVSNFIWSLSQVSGKYTAVCEGDDYWTDPLKLQKQVDFIEANATFSGIATQCKVLYENSSKTSHLFRNTKLDIVNLNDLLETRLFHTATFLFRSKCLKKDFPLHILSGDRVLFMLVASFGPIKLLQDVTAVYRKNEGGISRRVTSKQMKKDYKMVPFIKKYNQHFNVYKLKAFIAYTVLAYSHKIYKVDYFKASFYYVFYGYLSDRKLSISNHKKRLKKRLKFIKQTRVKI